MNKYFVAVILALGVTAAAQPLSIQLDGNIFKVAGQPASALRPTAGKPLFEVFAGTGDVPPLAGRTAIENNTLVFRPAYPLAPGVRYRAVFTPRTGATIEKTFDGPSRPVTPAARVERVYPSATVLPSNQLRLYIYFSAPMSRGEAEQRIHVLDAGGKVLRAVFLPGQELWDPNNQRLTMTFDPGRIKRDLTSNRSMGPPIAEERQYTLVIDREWRDANGVAMTDAFRKAFRGGPAIRQPPDPKMWKIAVPGAGTRAPLVVSFGRSMNYTLLQRMLRVGRGLGDVGGEVNGTIAVAKNEAEWRFTPTSPWTAASDYRLIVNDGLEDLAGNKIGQPFDIDVFDKVTERLTTGYTSIPFEIR